MSRCVRWGRSLADKAVIATIWRDEVDEGIEGVHVCVFWGDDDPILSHIAFA